MGGSEGMEEWVESVNLPPPPSEVVAVVPTAAAAFEVVEAEQQTQTNAFVILLIAENRY